MKETEGPDILQTPVKNVMGVPEAREVEEVETKEGRPLELRRMDYRWSSVKQAMAITGRNNS